MVCIYCHAKTRVINSRTRRKNASTWRRRQCKQCRAIFSTVEQPDLANSLVVKKSDGLVPFSSDAMFVSIYDSCRHRKDGLESARALTNTVIQKLLKRHSTATLEQSDITKAIYEVLRRFDKAAAVHFRAYHPL